MMAEIKDKVVTVESLATLHKHNENSYMSKDNPVGNGIMMMNGDAEFSGNVNVGTFMIGSKIKLVPTGDSLEIIFLDEEIINEG